MILSRKKLETELARNCMTISELVSKCGVSRSAFDTAMKEKEVRPNTVGKIAAALNTDVQNLIKE